MNVGSSTVGAARTQTNSRRQKTTDVRSEAGTHGIGRLEKREEYLCFWRDRGKRKKSTQSAGLRTVHPRYMLNRQKCISPMWDCELGRGTAYLCGVRSFLCGVRSFPPQRRRRLNQDRTALK